MAALHGLQKCEIIPILIEVVCRNPVHANCYNANFIHMASQTSPTIGNGKICYLEIPAANIEQSADFYKNVFGWNIRTRGDGATAFDDGVGEVSGAWHTDRKPFDGPGILIYIMVDDIHEAIEKIKNHKGTIVQEVGADAPEITARFKDPAGNIFGLYQEPE